MSTSVPPPGYDARPVDTPPAPDLGAAPLVVKRRLGSRAYKALGALAGLAAALGVVLALFGGTNNSVTDPIAQAATQSQNTPGFRMSLHMTVSSPILASPLTASGDAVVDLRDQAASMNLAVDFSSLPQAARALGGPTLALRMIIQREAVYLQLPPAAVQATPALGAKPWIKLDVGKLSGMPGLSSLGSNPTMSDPSHMLQYLRAASNGVTLVGQEQVDGVQTTHYHALLNLDRLGGQLPATDRAGLQRALAVMRQSMGGQGLPVDVWIDSNHLVRRIVMALALGSASAPMMRETVTADLSDYGPQPEPAAPPADQVKDLSSLVNISR